MLLAQNDLQYQPLEAQVERILRSEELRTSDVLRQILRFLLEKTVSGEADQLKEYTVAIEGLGRAATYDPQHNSAVRIQVSRLRQKLAEYYRGSGKDDAVIVEIPKGRFKLVCETRSLAPTVQGLDPRTASMPPEIQPLAAHQFGVSTNLAVRIGSILAAILLAFFVGRWSSAAGKNSADRWTPELAALWGPFVEPDRPLLISIEDPLFVEMRSYPGAFFRDRTLNSWPEVLNSQVVEGMRALFKNNEIQPSHYYTTFGEANAAFLIGNMLGPRAHAISIERTSEISFQQLADDNLIFVGVQNLFFDEKVNALPTKTQLAPVLEGVRNLHPEQGEQGMYVDQYSTAPTHEGFVYALITRLPGPRGNGNVESFTSNCSAGYLGAVQWMMDPESAKFLASRLKASSKEAPRYFQVLLKVKFKDEVPTETSYVLSRILQ